MKQIKTFMAIGAVALLFSSSGVQANSSPPAQQEQTVFEMKNLSNYAPIQVFSIKENNCQDIEVVAEALVIVPVANDAAGLAPDVAPRFMLISLYASSRFTNDHLSLERRQTLLFTETTTSADKPVKGKRSAAYDYGPSITISTV